MIDSAGHQGESTFRDEGDSLPGNLVNKNMSRGNTKPKRSLYTIKGNVVVSTRRFVHEPYLEGNQSLNESKIWFLF